MATRTQILQESRSQLVVGMEKYLKIYDHHYSREMNDQLRLKNGLLHIEKILDSLSYPDERKVSLAIILLDEEA
ncbi:hypothetical protein IEQ34_012834 [Dendrobium chrysotoxum]|uniref:Uncharacterized protein n=1 Tax=Dendrobium chrysotoxum TaxID=161865 RepID=A0AAV7GPW0_DENCH|nr:hypothetical protein IEQ34_012834 [Dendrobium chrysotoxum]